MDKSSLAPSPTLSTHGGSKIDKMLNSHPNKKDAIKPEQISNARGMFLNMAINMSWQLAVVVLVPILAGVKLDKVFGTHNILLFVGLGLALVGSVAVMWRAVQAANRLPVPKLTAEQKRAIKKSYEEEDKDE
jgi:F0F1-type ATP synthase assembly protein I